MSTKFDDAVIALYRAPPDQFVAERKRLAAELKAGGDKVGASQLTALTRPPISTWVVNQLWWEERDAFEELFAAGERLRSGDLSASNAHRDALQTMRAHAEKLLVAAGHAPNEATMRRIVTNLSALAAVSSFEPDPPGALAGDREPPGFDIAGMVVPEARQRPTTHAAAPKAQPKAHAAEHADKEVAAAREKERQRLEEERRKKAEEEQRRAERRRLDVALGRAKVDLEAGERELARIRAELGRAEKSVEQKREEIADIEARLNDLG